LSSVAALSSSNAALIIRAFISSPSRLTVRPLASATAVRPEYVMRSLSWNPSAEIVTRLCAAEDRSAKPRTSSTAALVTGATRRTAARSIADASPSGTTGMPAPPGR